MVRIFLKSIFNKNGSEFLRKHFKTSFKKHITDFLRIFSLKTHSIILIALKNEP